LIHLIQSRASTATRAARRLRFAAALAWSALASARGAHAQDFAPAAAAGPRPGPAALLDRALPVAGEALAVEGGEIRWFAMPGLETRGLSLLVPARSLRVAAGLSQTGDGELGWTCVALSLGAVSEDCGLALRAAARRDRAPGELLSSAASLGAGGEAGGGAWFTPVPGALLWATAPQLWVGGEAPPLARPLEMGARFEAGALSAWLALGAPREGDDGARLVGAAVARGPLAVWVEGRDAPARGAIGITADAGPLRVAARMEGHPVLGETTQLSLALRRPRPRDEL
jgi:hypothetical protein